MKRLKKALEAQAPLEDQAKEPEVVGTCLGVVVLCNILLILCQPRSQAPPSFLSLACSTEKRVEPGTYLFSCGHAVIQNEKAKFHVLFNQLQVQYLVCTCITVGNTPC